MSASLLVLNAGSSSLKFSLFKHPAPGWPTLLAHGEVADIDVRPRLRLLGADGALPAGEIPQHFSGTGHEAVLGELSALFARLFTAHPLRAVGHRVVHGGSRSTAACLVTPELLAELTALTPLAPLHQGHNLAPILAWQARSPDLPQVVAFDTAFHRSIAPARRRYALPAPLATAGVERYGFHGLSYEYIARRLAERDPRAGGRCVVLHLGAGASACALEQGVSRATSMGFTALDGLVMATRSGSLDPGLVLHLLEQHGLSPATLSEQLYRESGLLALSGGISGDMRTLLEASDPAAAEAVDHFCWRVRREIGALATELGGLDTLVFTAGIGEHAPAVRAVILDGLGHLGIALDTDANAHSAGRISRPESTVEVRVIPTDEEAMVAWHMRALLD